MTYELKDNEAAVVLDENGFAGLVIPNHESEDAVPGYPTQFAAALAVLIRDSEEFHSYVWKEWGNMIAEEGEKDEVS